MTVTADAEFVALSAGPDAVSGTEAAAATQAEAGRYFACTDLHAFYGESYIVQGVSFGVGEGEILALLGRNGAGKTSTLRAIARMDNPVLKRGEIRLAGKPLHTLRSFEAAQAGVQLVPEDRRIIGGLTVEENLILSQVAPPRGWPLERIYERFPRLAERRRQEATTLSGGEQQMLAVARALAREIKLLLLDEPYEGLAPVIVQEIERIVAGIKAEGITTIIVEQNAVAALQLADRAVILDMGEVVFDGSPDTILNDRDLRAAYLAI
jgi:branched-chain amino acid transport system ATP-binding protein